MSQQAQPEMQPQPQLQSQQQMQPQPQMQFQPQMQPLPPQMQPQMQPQNYIQITPRKAQYPPCTTKTTIKVMPPDGADKSRRVDVGRRKRRRRRGKTDDNAEDDAVPDSDARCFCRVFKSDAKSVCSCGAYKGGIAEKDTLVCKCRKPVKASKIMKYCERCTACAIENQRHFDEMKNKKYKEKIYLQAEKRKLIQETKMKKLELKYKVKHYLKYLKKTENEFKKNTAIDFKAVKLKDKGIQHIASGRERLFTTVVNLLKNLRTEEPPKRTICLVEPGPCFIKYALQNELYDTSTNPLHSSYMIPITTATTTILRALHEREPCLPEIRPFEHAMDACRTVQRLACRPPACCIKVFKDPCFTKGLLTSDIKPKY